MDNLYQMLAVLVNVLAVFTYCSSHGAVASSICCVPDQMEAVLIYDLGQCFIDTETAYSFTNSTVRLAYDYTNKRMYLNITALEISPLIPTPVTERTTIIYDYAKGIQYAFDEASCTKYNITEPMTQLCIPGNATLTSQFHIGTTDLPVKVYSFTSSGDLKAKVRTTIDPKTCIPVSQEWILGFSDSDSGTVNQLQVMNVTRGIKDSNIFTPPKSCFNGLHHKGHYLKKGFVQKFLPHLKTPIY